MKELSDVFKEKTEALPKEMKELIEAERAADQRKEGISEEVAAYLNFQQELFGHTANRIATPSKAR